MFKGIDNYNLFLYLYTYLYAICTEFVGEAVSKMLVGS